MRRRWPSVATLLLAICLAAPAGAAALGKPGDLDPTFHGGKPVLADLAKTVPRTTYFSEIQVDGAGRIVVSGDATDAGGYQAAVLARFSADGAPDPSFGEGGSDVFQLGTGSSPYTQTNTLFKLPGRYLALGVYRIVGARRQPTVFGLGENGLGDPGFGNASAGMATVNYPEEPSDGSTEAAAAAPDGTVYASGTTSEPGNQSATELVKFTAEGRIGENFPGLLGVYLKKFGQQSGHPESGGGPVATLPDDSALVAGTATLPAGGIGLLLFHISEGGILDSGFGEHEGFSVINVEDPASPIHVGSPTSILVGPDREIYVTGVAHDAEGEQEGMVARFSPNGRLDYTFGSGGIKRMQLAPPGQGGSGFNHVALQPDGKVDLIGSLYGSKGGSRIVQLNNDGSLDPGFGTDGIVVPDLGGEETQLSGELVAWPRLLVAGDVKESGHLVGAVASYLLGSLPDPTPAAGRGKLQLRKKKLAVDAKGHVRLFLACSAAGPCSGRIALVSATGKATLSAASKAKIYAKAGYQVAAGARKTVTLKLAKPLRARARAKAGVSARLLVAAKGDGTQTFRVKLHR